MEGFEEMKKLLEECNQSHILKYWKELKENEQRAFLEQLESINFKAALQMFAKAKEDHAKRILLDDLSPVDVVVEKDVPYSNIEEYRKIGLEEISNGSVAVIVLAGGQGTRLGMPYPKGMCPTGIPSGKTLFQIQAERIQRLTEIAKEKTGKEGKIHWYLMTSEATHVLTEKYLEQNVYFDLKKENVKLFQQAQVPCFDLEGNVLLEEKDGVALAPNGNGGIYKALEESGIYEDMEIKGIKYIHVHSVDNILIKVADPVFIGKCVKDKVDCGLKVLKKRDAKEPLGLVVKVKDQIQVVEYSEISSNTAGLTKPDGELLFNTGNICNHFFTVDYLKNVSNNYENDLKIHRAKKIATQIGPDGDKMRPSTPNCYKLEKFIFDAIIYTKNILVWQTERAQEFSPIKNSDVCKKDCFDTARRDLLTLHKTWVENAGGKCKGEGIEVSPLLSYEGENLEKVKGREFENGEVLLSEEEEKQMDRRG